MSACCGVGGVSSNVSYMKPMVVVTVVWEWNIERRNILGLQGVGMPVICLHALSLHPFPLCSALHGRLNYACQTDVLIWLQVQCYQLKGRIRLCQPRKVGANLPGFIQQQHGNRDSGECPGSRARTSSSLSSSPGADSRLPSAEGQPSFLCSSTSLFSIAPEVS